ncbi:monoglyceride lipase-like isoform X4 [Tachypleus tridentatus]|uniref:monoglyceride lipase-like isoform X4 n=1 Tax=Tachypleus tridentatus TaxID=6853 RepID=UPI003FD407A5
MPNDGELPKEDVNCFYIKSCTGNQLFCKNWLTEGKPRALAFVAHGYAEHCCVFEDFAQALVKSQILTFGHDHVGHGRSEGARTLVGNLDNCVEDVFLHINKMKEKYPRLPVFLVGHSMGGTIGILAALKKPDEFSGFVAIAAGISWNAQGVTPLKIVQADLKNVDVPLLIHHGGQDKICDISGAKKLYETSKTKDKTLKVYPNSYHCLLLEPDGIPEQVIGETVNWITARIQ